MKKLKYIKIFNESINTRNSKSSELKHFLDFVRRYHVSEIPQDSIDKYVDSYLNSVDKDDVFIKMMKK